MKYVLPALIAVNIAITLVLLTKKSASPAAVADSKLAEAITPTLALHRDELRSTMTHNNTTIEERLGKFRESLDGNAQLTRQDAENGRAALEKSLKISLGDVEETLEFDNETKKLIYMTAKQMADKIFAPLETSEFMTIVSRVYGVIQQIPTRERYIQIQQGAKGKKAGLSAAALVAKEAAKEAAAADYREGSALDLIVKGLIGRIAITAGTVPDVL